MTRRAHRAAAALAAVAVGATLASCGGGRDDGRSVEVEGTTVVTDGGRQSVLRSGRHRVPTGSVLRVTSGSAILDLVGDATAELRAATPGAPDSSVRVAAVPTLLVGEALVAASDRARFGVGDVVVTVEGGVARVRQLSSTTVGTYTGVASVDARGRPVRVPAFRQLTLAGVGAVPRHPGPLVYDQQTPDTWDSRYLGAAIDIGQQLDRRSAALTAQLARPQPTAAYLAGLLPALRRQPGFADSLVPTTAVGETLVGAAITLGARPRDFVSGWRGVFDFRAEGARWGLVAVDQQARRTDVVAGLDGVLGRVPLRFAGPAATGTTSTTVPRRPSGGGRTTPTSSPPTTQPAGPTPTLPTLTVPRVSTSPTTAPRSDRSTGNSSPPAVPPTTLPPTTLPPTTLPPPTVPQVPQVPQVTVPPTSVVKPIQDILGGILGK